jgi:hypothetical protein
VGTVKVYYSKHGRIVAFSGDKMLTPVPVAPTGGGVLEIAEGENTPLYYDICVHATSGKYLVLNGVLMRDEDWPPPMPAQKEE